MSRHITARPAMYPTMRRFLRTVSLVLVALVATLSAPFLGPLWAQSPAPDVIFIGQFLTLDRSHPQAEAIAVPTAESLRLVPEAK